MIKMKHNAFTLAEVLITLALIGIVAAITLPSLTSKIRRKQDAVKLEKFYSLMSQAVILSTIDNGSPAEWIINAATRDKTGEIIDYQYEACLTFFETYFSPYIKTVELQLDSDGIGYAGFADGSVVYFSNGNCIDMNYDTNGAKEPNKAGKDQFDFLFCNGNYNESYIGKNKYFGTYYEDTCLKNGREYTLNHCKNNALICASLLLIDNWEFKDDYPYKL